MGAITCYRLEEIPNNSTVIIRSHGVSFDVYEKLNANLAKAVMSIGAVKGFEIGDGFDVAKATGKTNNDAFIIFYSRWYSIWYNIIHNIKIIYRKS